jgi:hypothetical protein
MPLLTPKADVSHCLCEVVVILLYPNNLQGFLSSRFNHSMYYERHLPLRNANIISAIRTMNFNISFGIFPSITCKFESVDVISCSALNKQDRRCIRIICGELKHKGPKRLVPSAADQAPCSLRIITCSGPR